MHKSGIQLDVNGGSLWGVPAVHFRYPFAEAVHDLCTMAATRPQAIAVELGPQTAAAARQWFGELGVRPGARFDLPCMLALTRANRRLHPSVKEQAERLQQSTGRDLHELPPDVLKEVLGYSAVSVLYLSPTDSIIEAIRCSLELGVPLYGVDLEETAARKPHEGILEDPLAACEGIERYATQNLEFSDGHRDEFIDGRREVAMAARLKTIVERHGTVLFTGGLAHWKRLQQLLADDSIRPAPADEAGSIVPEDYQRVVVNPLLAIYHMDLFPEFARRFEQRRDPADKSNYRVDPIDAGAVFSQLLQEAQRSYFVDADGAQRASRQPDYECYPHFEQFLINLCRVRQLRVSDLFTALLAAQSTMSPQYAKVLADVLMRFNWARPEDFDEELPILTPYPTEAGKPTRAEFVEPHSGRRGRYFYIDPLPGRGGGYTVSVPIPWEWKDEKPPPPPPPGADFLQGWLPCCTLRSALSLLAMERARMQAKKPRTEEFKGNLHDGLDLKATLRAHSRGDRRFYVIDTPPRRKVPPSGPTRWQPVVWITQPPQETKTTWFVFGDNIRDYLLPHVKNRARLESQMLDPVSGGRHMVHQVGFGTVQPDAELSYGEYQIQRVSLSGVLLYIPSFFTTRQTARWAEEFEYKRLPLISGFTVWYSPDALVNTLEKRHNVKFHLHDWQNTLIRMAIPYADKDAVTVVAPDGFVVDDVVYRDAAREGVEIRQVPLSYFDRQLVMKAMQEIMSPIVREGENQEPVFPEFLERRMNEKQSAYRNLIPKQILHFGLDNEVT